MLYTVHDDGRDHSDTRQSECRPTVFLGFYFRDCVSGYFEELTSVFYYIFKKLFIHLDFFFSNLVVKIIKENKINQGSPSKQMAVHYKAIKI